MPNFPDMIEGDPNELPNTTNLVFGAGEEFSAGFASGLSQIRERNIVNNPLRKPAGEPLSRLDLLVNPKLRPITKDELAEKHKDRPGLEIPESVSVEVAEAMAQRYDDDKYFSYVNEHPKSLMAKIAAFGGSMASGMLDLPSLALGGGLGKLVQLGYKPIAKQFMERMAVKEIFGSRAAQVTSTMATKFVGHTATTSAGFAGYQVGVEAQIAQEKSNLNQPFDYIQSLQNVGHAAEFGAIFGGVTGVLGAALLGIKVPRGGDIAKAGKPLGKGESGSPPGGDEGDFVRVGGLINSEAFKGVSQKAKDIISKSWLPWSKDADVTMKEESAGQVLNGQSPKLDVIVRQGQIDEGARFRDLLLQEGVDVETLSNELESADGVLNTQLRDILRLRSELTESDKTLAIDEGKAIQENKELSQAGIFKRFEQAQFESSFLEDAPQTIPENLVKRVELQRRIDELKAKIRESSDEKPNKQTLKRIEQLEKRLPKILTPKEELGQIKNSLLGRKQLPKDFTNSNAYKRLVDLAQVWDAAKNLLDRVHLEAEHQAQMADLLSQKIVLESIRNHVDDGHPDVTQSEMKAYSDHLKSVGLPETDYVLPDSKDVTFDERLVEFENSSIKELLELPELKELKEEYEAGEKRIKNQDKFADMTRKMTDCILKGAM